MKAPNQPNSTGLPFAVTTPRRYFRLTSLRSASLLPALLTPLLAVGLSGCLSIVAPSRRVKQTVLVTQVMDATLDELNSQLAKQYAAVQTLNAHVDIKATSGGQHSGEVREIPTLSGFMLLRKPSDLHVILQLPVVGSRALETVSDGKTFKLLVPSNKTALEGSEEVTTPSKKGFENLRPTIIREALLVPAVLPSELVGLVNGSRILPPAPGKKENTEEPDYDLNVYRLKKGNELEPVRVIHIGRVTLKPYQQDIYDQAGRLVTIVTYDNYQKSNGIDFPMSITISRPIDEYTLKITITKLTLNEPLDDESFKLEFPDNIPVQKMP